MKLLFLDIDGVLNCESTKERFKGFIGIDARLRDLFLGWLAGKEMDVVLSSTWRWHDDFKEHLRENGLSWIGETPRISGPRGGEIQTWITPDITHYAILDDNSDMLPHQREHFVQTSYRHGLRPRNLKRLDEVLEL